MVDFIATLIVIVDVVLVPNDDGIITDGVFVVVVGFLVS